MLKDFKNAPAYIKVLTVMFVILLAILGIGMVGCFVFMGMKLYGLGVYDIAIICFAVAIGLPAAAFGSIVANYYKLGE